MIDRLDSEGLNRTGEMDERLADSRKAGGQPLEKKDVLTLCESGQQDFSGVVFAEDQTISDVKITSLVGAVVKGVKFVRCDFRGTSFSDVDMGRTKLLACDISGADFSFSTIGESGVDFHEDQKMLLKKTLLSITVAMIESVTACDDAEPRFSALFFDGEFNHEGDHYGEGIVLKSDGVVLGVLKQNAEDSFLATRTIVDVDGNVLLWKGGIYQIHYPQLKQLEALLALKNKAAGPKKGGVSWPVVDIDNFAELSAKMISPESRDFGNPPAFKMNFVRFLQDRTMYERLEEWTKVLEHSDNVVDLP